MRWKTPHFGDVRIIKRFLLFPCTLGNDARWLETAYVVQKFENRYMDNPEWAWIQWADKDSYETYRTGTIDLSDIITSS